MDAPQDFCDWLSSHEHPDPVYGWLYRYHPRSDAHSIRYGKLVPAIWLKRVIRFGNTRWRTRSSTTSMPNISSPTGRKDARSCDRDAEGRFGRRPVGRRFVPARSTEFSIACEAKTCMTEHSKSQPRIFDELGSSHEIVHQGDRQAIAAGITVVNIAATFISPLRQKSKL